MNRLMDLHRWWFPYKSISTSSRTFKHFHNAIRAGNKLPRDAGQVLYSIYSWIWCMAYGMLCCMFAYCLHSQLHISFLQRWANWSIIIFHFTVKAPRLFTFFQRVSLASISLSLSSSPFPLFLFSSRNRNEFYESNLRLARSVAWRAAYFMI